MPHADPERRREYRRALYAQRKAQGLTRDWGTISAICPVCGKIRNIGKNSHGITKLPKNEQGHIIKRCRSCSKRKDYAPWFDKNYIRDRQSEIRKQLKIRCIIYLGSKCIECGLVFDGTNAYAFDFHHVIPDGKEFLPASKYRRWERVVTELDKCELRCAICHRRVHTVI